MEEPVIPDPVDSGKRQWCFQQCINLCRSDNSRNRILLLLYAHNMHEISEMWEAAAILHCVTCLLHHWTSVRCRDNSWSCPVSPWSVISIMAAHHESAQGIKPYCCCYIRPRLNSALPQVSRYWAALTDWEDSSQTLQTSGNINKKMNWLKNQICAVEFEFWYAGHGMTFIFNYFFFFI